MGKKQWLQNLKRRGENKIEGKRKKDEEQVFWIMLKDLEEASVLLSLYEL